MRCGAALLLEWPFEDVSERFHRKHVFLRIISIEHRCSSFWMDKMRRIIICDAS
jgi:hypothetical protein